MEGKLAGLRARVIDVLRVWDEAIHASDGQNVAAVAFHHGGEEFFAQEEVRDDVDGEGLIDVLLRQI